MAPVHSFINNQPAQVISSQNLTSPPQVEFRIQDGNVVEKKNLTSQLLLQSRFITSNNFLKPCLPFLPSFTMSQPGIVSLPDENLPQTSEGSTSNFSLKLTSKSKSKKYEKVYICAVCTKEFSTKTLLKKHSVIHGPPNVHCCSTCHKVFTRRTLLKRHELTHTSERPHTCQECGKGLFFIIVYILRKKLLILFKMLLLLLSY